MGSNPRSPSRSGVTALAGANIAFIKYWGNRLGGDNLPLNPSISMTLSSCLTTTTVELLPEGAADEVLLDGKQPAEASCASTVHSPTAERTSGPPYPDLLAVALPSAAG